MGLPEGYLQQILDQQNSSGRLSGPDVDNKHRSDMTGSFDSAALDAKTKDAPAKSPLLANSAVLRSLTRECRTVDQATAVYKLLDVLTQKTLQTTLSLTAARGRVGVAGEGEKRENRRRWA